MSKPNYSSRQTRHDVVLDANSISNNQIRRVQADDSPVQSILHNNSGSEIRASRDVSIQEYRPQIHEQQEFQQDQEDDSHSSPSESNEDDQSDIRMNDEDNIPEICSNTNRGINNNTYAVNSQKQSMKQIGTETQRNENLNLVSNGVEASVQQCISPNKSRRHLIERDSIINDRLCAVTIYDLSSSCLRSLFVHVFKYMSIVRNNITKYGTSFTDAHLPMQAQQDKIEEVYPPYQDVFTKPKDKLTLTYFYQIFFMKSNRYITLFMVILGMVETYSRFIISVMLQYLIDYVKQSDIQSAYIVACLLGILSLLAICSKHYQQYQCSNVSSKMRLILTNLLYDKVIKLSSQSIKLTSIGKIMNLVSGDINQIEFQLNYLYALATIPGSILFAGIILWIRFNGPLGLIAMFICVLLYPVQLIIQKQAQKQLQLAKIKQDQRIKVQNEQVDGIRLIKMYAWESAFIGFINKARQAEYINYFKIHGLTMIDRSFNQSVHIWGSFIFILIIHLSGQEIGISQIVSTIQLMSLIKFYCVYQVSYALQAIITLNVAFQRVIEIIQVEETYAVNLDKHSPGQSQEGMKLMSNIDVIIQDDSIRAMDSVNNMRSVVVLMKNLSCYWKANGVPILKNINFCAFNAECVGIIGKVGSGKTTFLEAMMKEIPYITGSLQVKDDIKIAYVEQQPFIYTATVKDNVLFGKHYESSLYQKVLQVSCLDQDLIEMQDGDLTEIGEKGANLSGGQRARLSLARALYSLSDIYLLDDPLSAVDAKVARKIFSYAIKEFIFDFQPKYLKSQNIPTVFLVTHQIQYSLECDYLIVIDEGEIVAKGQYLDIAEKLQDLFPNQINAPKARDRSPTKKQTSYRVQFKQQQKSLKRRNTTKLFTMELNSLKSSQNYKRYFLTWFPKYLIFFIILQNVATEIINNVYYRIMTLYESDSGYSLFFQAGMLVMAAYLNNVLKYLLTIWGVLRCNNTIQSQMVQALSRASVGYYDTNPSGRIMNRFSNDLSIADMQVQIVLMDIFESGSQFIVSLVTVVILQPYFGLPLLATIYLTIMMFKLSHNVISSLKNCDLIQRSPLFEQFKQAIYGVIQIRLSQQQLWFKQKFQTISNTNIQANLMFQYSQKCFNFYIDIIGQVANSAGTFLIIALIDDISLFSQALLLLSTFHTQTGMLRQIMTFDSIMNSFNRMFEICDIQEEGDAYLSSDDKLIVKAWPRTGHIQFRDVYLQYRPEMPHVLCGLNFTVQPKQKVGVVGRTGAGKSSIISALFRMQEIDEDGFITIDGLNIKQIGLTRLRSSIGIIPQVPFLFNGTIRKNLDPEVKHTDYQIWKVLHDVALNEYIEAMPNQLETDISNVDEMFSIGQRQVICLARVLLNKKKILVLDEATANLDMATDQFIQQLIKEKFYDCTIITIAHRLNTIADYDKVLVMDMGKVEEYAHPYELLVKNVKTSRDVDSDSKFANMVRETGIKNAISIYDIAKQNYAKLQLKLQYKQAKSSLRRFSGDFPQNIIDQSPFSYRNIK